MSTIVEEIRNDREKGAKRLESEYKEGLLVFARRLCSDESDAEALVYRTFSEVIEGIDGYSEQSAFFGWMCKILVNCHAKDVRRKSNSTITVTDELPEIQDEDGAERVFSSVDSAILRDAVIQLPKAMKDAVILHYFMEMSLKEIATFMSVPVGTVMSRLHYARIALARRLGANLKKPAVALIAAAMFLLLGATAAVVGLRGTETANQDELVNQDAAAESVTSETSAPSELPESPSQVSSVPQVTQVLQLTPKGEETMTGKKAAAAALTAALAASAPLGAANGDEYQFIISGDPIAAETVDSSESASIGTALVTSMHTSPTEEASLEARYRTFDESAGIKLRTDTPKGLIISFK